MLIGKELNAKRGMDKGCYMPDFHELAEVGEKASIAYHEEKDLLNQEYLGENIDLPRGIMEAIEDWNLSRLF